MSELENGAEDGSTVLQTAAARASSASVKDRQGVFGTSITSAVNDPGFPLAQQAVQLSSIIFQTLFTYGDRASRSAVERVIQLASKRELVFAKAFVTQLIQVVERSHRAVSDQTRYQLLRWSCAVLRCRGQEIAASSAAFTRLATAQSALLTDLLSTNYTHSHKSVRVQHFAERTLLSVIKESPSLLAAYVDVLKSFSTTWTLDCCGLVAVLLQYLSSDSKHGELWERVKPQMLELYAKVVFGAKERPPAFATTVFAPALQQASHEEFSSVVLPAAVRALKRSPEVGLPTLNSLLSNVSLDLSKDAAELLPSLLQLARHADDSLRTEALAVAKRLAKQSSNPDAVQAMFEAAKRILQGKAARMILQCSEGKLQVWYHRAGVVGVVASLAESESSKALSAVAPDACTLLASLYKDEGNDDVKTALMSAIVIWLMKVHDISAPIISTFVAGLKDKENIRRAHLRCIVQVLQAKISCTQQASMVQLAEPLLQLLKSSFTKPAFRIDGVYALLALATMASADSSIDERLVKEKVWATVLQKDSPVLSAAVLAKTTLPDCLALVQLTEAVLLHHQTRVTANMEGAQGLFQLVVQLVLHPAWKVRQAATAAAAKFGQASLGISDALLDALSNWLQDSESFLPDSEEGTTQDDALFGVRSRVCAASVASAAFQSLTPPAATSIASKQWGPQYLMLLAHHPSLNQGAPYYTAWQALVHKMGREGSDFLDTLKVGTSLLCFVAVSEQGAQSERPAQRTAALNTLRSAMRDFPENTFPALMPVLSELADRAEHDRLTPEDLDVFNTPAGQLANEKGVYVAEIVANRNVRRAKGRFKLYEDYEDELTQPSAPAPAAAAPKKEAAKGGKKTPADAAKNAKQEAREAQLKEEAAVRVHVRSIGRRLAIALDAVGAVATANIEFTHKELGALAELTLPLVASPLVSDNAAATMEQLASCTDPSTRPMAPLFAAALRHVALSKVDVSASEHKSAAEVGVVKNSIEALSTACQQGPLTAPTFHLIFPILEYVLLSPVQTSLHEEVLHLCALHTSPETAVPRQQMLAALYYVHGCNPTLHQEQVLTMLKQLCTGLHIDQADAALAGLLSEHRHVRAACLAALPSIPTLVSGTAQYDQRISAMLWMACYDPEEANQEAAEALFDQYNNDLGERYGEELVTLLSHKHENVRQAASKAIAAAMRDYPSTVQETLAALFGLYIKNCPLPPPPPAKPGEFGFGLKPPPPPPDTWEAREGVALTLTAAAEALTQRELPVVATFLMSRALSDKNAEVRGKMVEAGVAMITVHGKENMALLLPIFENYLDKKAVDEKQYDLVREGVVVFLGALARHLVHDAQKVTNIVDRLLEVLNTPSETVQRAVSGCLPPLVPALQSDVAPIVEQLLQKLMKSDRYAERKGGAYGLAGVVKGLGISSLKKYGIMNRLKAGAEDRADPRSREGALFAFESLCDKLGRLFEPYIIHILPILLTCFSDAMSGVRDAAESAARAIMANLSGQGVKLILPALLKGLEDKLWRTKQGSVQLLGAMAFCAPRQLSSCLPLIVPRLSETLTDTHPKVQSAAQLALQQVGSVIRNPEIASLTPVLLVAIADPNNNTRTALDMLLSTTFSNSVDAPSLALLVPIVHRGLRERSTETKKKAAQIVGNMCSLITEPKDMVPYLDLVIPELRKVLIDPNPDVRGICAKAFGSLLQGMGQEHFPDLVPWLLEVLCSDGSNVERSGAAQGLSEVLAVLGRENFERLLPEILSNCSHKNVNVRDGYLGLFKFLPTAFGDVFQQYLGQVLPAILDGLADESEMVRDAALAAGRQFVEQFAETSLPLLLPAVEEGVFNDNWRIRQSSVELLGDLLFKARTTSQIHLPVAGTSGKAMVEGHGSDDEGASTEAQGRAILLALGRDKRDEVLAALYTCRSDVSLVVRQSALHVWKTIVANTPRTLKEILPTLMKMMIDSLGSSSSERRLMAGRALGELVRKLGERVLPAIIPILQKDLQDESATTRQGVCFGLSEVMASAGRQTLVSYMSDLIPTVRQALCDPSPEVREAASEAFNTLYKNGGMQVIDEIVPSLLEALEVEEISTNALEGLKTILTVRSAAVLPHILPKLVQSPISSFYARALGVLAEVAGEGMHVHLSMVLPPLLESMGNLETKEAATEAAEKVVSSVEQEGVGLLMDELLKALTDSQVAVRIAALHLIAHAAKQTDLDLEDNVTYLITAIVGLFNDANKDLLTSAVGALGAVTGGIPKEELPTYTRCVRDAVSTARDKERRKRRGMPVLVPGLCLPKALQPMLPIFLQGLMNGSPDMREQAADGIGELVSVTSEETLKPFVIPITGPLIRIIGDRFPSPVKSAILGTLAIMIDKGGVSLKPFVPQMQTTFIKSLQDNSSTVRSRAARALGKLMKLSARVDPLISELIGAIKTSEGGVREAMLAALRGVVVHGGSAASAGALEKVLQPLLELLSAEEDELRRTAAHTLAIYAMHVDAAAFASLVRLVASTDRSRLWQLRYGHALTLASILRHAGAKVVADESLLTPTKAAIKSQVTDDKVPVRETGTKAIGRLLTSQLALSTSGTSSMPDFAPSITTLLSDEASDVRRRALSAVKAVAKADKRAISPFLPQLGPAIAVGLNDRVPHVRTAAERAMYRCLQCQTGGLDSVPAYVTAVDARRLSKLPANSDASDESEAEYDNNN
eukprot:jgi/Chlat1/7777/Chrsp66S07244